MKGLLGWYNAKLATPGQQINRMILEPQSMPKPPTYELYQKWQGDYINDLAAIDGRLSEKPYLCGNDITLGDIVVFNDIAQFLAVTNTDLNHPDLDKHANVKRWFNKMEENEIVLKHANDMRNALKDVKKVIPT